MMKLLEKEFREQQPLTKRGRPPLKKRAMTDVERNRKYRRNKTPKAKRKAARRARDEADRRVAETTGCTYAVHHIGIDDVTADILADASVDAVITDPPYAEKYLPLYSSLGRFSARVLKPGGWCVIMTGNGFLEEIISGLKGHLECRWPYSIPTPGGLNNRNYAIGLFQTWKLVLLYQKPPLSRIREWWPDLIAAKRDEYDKSAHPWQQSEAVFAELVKRFTVAGDLVVDPFAGSGTTGRAAVSQGRHFWGCDIDAECATAAQGAGYTATALLSTPTVV
jgi:16S rRNA G966 N2-methylase RsmD